MSGPRSANPADLDAVLALHRDFFAEDHYTFREEESRANLARLLADPGLGRVFVLEDGGTVAGYLVLTFGFSLELGGRDGLVDELYVAPAHRGRGLGTQALAAAEEACRELGIRAIHLVVERYKEDAQALYRRVGFVAHEREVMTKALITPALFSRPLPPPSPGEEGERQDS
ncbi:MAG TPA: GNAT family N-acetyltransferase [Thermoanaerobaculia bacterium]|nr:GNAT family N-acetyltransferase [Thermoanaerobaculia bacterium]